MTRAVPSPVRALVLALVCAALAVVLGAPPAQAELPDRSQWLADVALAMDGAEAHLDQRVVAGGRLAVNLDIDNTSLATRYEPGRAVEAVLHFARHARAHDVAVLFNTGRVVGDGRIRRARRQLLAAGYPVTGICGRSSRSETLAASKQRCRQRFVDRGHTIIANVGNRRTDFVGAHYERAFRLPSYDNQLG